MQTPIALALVLAATALLAGHLVRHSRNRPPAPLGEPLSNVRLHGHPFGEECNQSCDRRSTVREEVLDR